SGAIKDASHLWWAIRPSLKYPTLELRAPDCCTRLDDAVAIAALYRVLARHLYLDPEHNAGLDVVDRSIAVENKWRGPRASSPAPSRSRTSGGRSATARPAPSPPATARSRSASSWTASWTWSRRMPQRWAAPPISSSAGLSPSRGPRRRRS